MTVTFDPHDLKRERSSIKQEELKKIEKIANSIKKRLKEIKSSSYVSPRNNLAIYSQIKNLFNLCSKIPSFRDYSHEMQERLVDDIQNDRDEQISELIHMIDGALDWVETEKSMGSSNNLKSNEKFITLNHEEHFYQRLECEINLCYVHGTYTAVLILSRKLIENLLIDVLRKKYRTNNIQMYYRTDSGRFHDFTILLKHFEDNKDDFIDKDIIEEFIRLVKPFRKSANRKAHSIVHLIEKKEDLKEFDVQKLASLLMRLYSKI